MEAGRLRRQVWMVLIIERYPGQQPVTELEHQVGKGTFLRAGFLYEGVEENSRHEILAEGVAIERRERKRDEKETRKKRKEKGCDEMSDDKIRFFFSIERHSTVVNNIVYATIRRREIARRTRDKFDYMNQYEVDPALAGCARRVNERALYSIVDRYYYGERQRFIN